MKILLVVPRYKLTNKKNYEYLFPLGLGYISSVLKKNNYNVDCINLNHHEGTVDEIMKKTLDLNNYDIVCSGHLGIGYATIEKIIHSVREHPSKPKFILGGALITSVPELLFNALNPDYAILGEGEVTIIELLDAIENKKDLNEVDGIMYKDNEKIIITKPRKAIEYLDSLPFPDFEGLGFEEKLENTSWVSFLEILDYPRDYSILCSRGCPFQCTFCYHCLGPKYRTRSLDNVMEELRIAIKKYKINHISIYDDLFSVDKERLYEFCRRIKEVLNEVPWKCYWFCQLTVHNVDREMLRTLKDAGCCGVGYGFESYSPVILKSMKKPITPEQIDRAIKLSMEEKIAIQGNFLFGDRAETRETAKETLDYWKNNCKGQLRLAIVQPYPGSELYKHCIKKGIIKDELDYIKNKMANINWFNMTDSMTDKEFLELREEIMKARMEPGNYIIPIKIKIQDKYQKIYSSLVKCPFCSEIIEYKNCFIPNKYLYITPATCRNCYMRFNMISLLYKFALKHYDKLDPIRKNYLKIRDKFLKTRL